jgi:hypothetical protein
MKYSKIKKVLSIAVLMLCISFVAEAGTSFTFSPSVFSVKEGQSVTTLVSVVPDGIPIYTVKVSAKFTPDTLSLKSWAFDGDLMPLRKDGFDSFDNIGGTFVRTAGIPYGITKKAMLGKATFVAKKTGTASVSFMSDSMALDGDSINQYTGGNRLIVNISKPIPRPVVAVEQAKEKEIEPASGVITFDSQEIITTPISFLDEKAPLISEQNKHVLVNTKLKENSIGRASELSAQISMQNKATYPTPVVVEYFIYDKNGSLFYNASEDILVDNEYIKIKTFENLNLEKGNYTINLIITQGANLKDRASYEFSVKGGFFSRLTSIEVYGISVIPFLLVFLILIIGIIVGKNLIIPEWKKKEKMI